MHFYGINYFLLFSFVFLTISLYASEASRPLPTLPADAKDTIIEYLLCSREAYPSRIYLLKALNIISQEWHRHINTPARFKKYLACLAQTTDDEDELTVAKSLSKMRATSTPEVRNWLEKVDSEKHLHRRLFMAITNPRFHRWIPIFLCTLSIDTANEEGTTPLIKAAGYAPTLVVEEILRYKPSLNKPTKCGWTALKRAIANKRLENAKLLLAAGANPDIVDDEGWTALMKASHDEYAPGVQLLLEAHADCNRRAYDGWTALMRATANGNTTIVKMLLKKAADPRIKNKEKPPQTALDIAQKRSSLRSDYDARIIELLTKYEIGK